MADFSTYTALRGVDNWTQRRADEKYTMAVREKQKQNAEIKLQQYNQSEQYYNQYMDQIKQLEVLGADQKKVKEAEAEHRMNVVQGLTQFNGDVGKFMQGGGLTVLNDYKNNILEDERVTRAISNKTNHAQILKAKSEGLFVHDVPVRMVVKGEDGQIKRDDEGNPVYSTRMVAADEQINLLNQGYTDQISFNGAEEDVEVTYKDFLHRFKNNLNPGSGDNLVTAGDVQTWIIEKGGSKQQAAWKAQQYIDQVKKGATPYQWKYFDKTAEELKRSAIAKNRAQTNLARKQSAEFDKHKLDWVANVVSMKGAKNGQKTTIPGNEGITNFFNQYYGITKNKNGTVNLPNDMVLYGGKDFGNKEDRDMYAYSPNDFTGGYFIQKNNFSIDDKDMGQPMTYVWDSKEDVPDHLLTGAYQRAKLRGDKYVFDIVADVNEGMNYIESSAFNWEAAKQSYNRGDLNTNQNVDDRGRSSVMSQFNDEINATFEGADLMIGD